MIYKAPKSQKESERIFLLLW